VLNDKFLLNDSEASTMASTYSFDIVSDFDRQELVNALDQTRREVGSRYDLKDTKTEIDLSGDTLTIETASQMSWMRLKPSCSKRPPNAIFH
jgi:uncharacterized protein YajQ (UPF0234 family)